MSTKAFILLVFVLSILVASCGRGDQTPNGKDDTRAPTGDIRDHLRKPGKVTHVRYTSYTPPWPTRTEAWIDWENDRARSWNVQWTDSPTNPSICTSIRNGDDWYPCLPSSFKVEATDFARLYALYPRVPLRASPSELSLPFPQGFFAEDTGTAMPVQIDEATRTTREAQGDATLLLNSWKITSDLDLPCPEEGQTASASFEYTTTEEGEPISEFITLACGEESQRYFGVLYHEIEFVDASGLPAGFFEFKPARASLIEDGLSSAAAQLGSVFWLGDEAGDWKLDGLEQFTHSASVRYTRGDGDDGQVVELTTRAPAIGRVCLQADPIPNDRYDGSLCTREGPKEEYTVVWTVPGFDAWMETDSYPSPVSRDDALALAARLERWEKKASGPLLTSDAVSNLIADSLELVCPTKRAQIREERERASLDFSRETGEWTGAFGVFGEYAVPDSKPVAIPVNNREEVESTLSHNAAQFADCVADEQPPPQEGDDEFAVTFVGKDESGLTFEVTGVDADVEAALAFCMMADGDCALMNPEGRTIDTRGVESNSVRPQVLRIHLGVADDELTQTGEWTLTLDLGEGRTARVTFDVR